MCVKFLLTNIATTAGLSTARVKWAVMLICSWVAETRTPKFGLQTRTFKQSWADTDRSRTLIHRRAEGVGNVHEDSDTNKVRTSDTPSNSKTDSDIMSLRIPKSAFKVGKLFSKPFQPISIVFWSKLSS